MKSGFAFGDLAGGGWRKKASQQMLLESTGELPRRPSKAQQRGRVKSRVTETQGGPDRFRKE